MPDSSDTLPSSPGCRVVWPASAEDQEAPQCRRPSRPGGRTAPHERLPDLRGPDRAPPGHRLRQRGRRSIRRHGSAL